MSLDRFHWVPSWGTEVSQKTRVRRAQLGDGYMQLSPDGINPTTEVWSLTFENIRNDVAADIKEFLTEHTGKAFEFVTPEGVIKPFWCEQGVRYTFVGGKVCTLTCTFEEFRCA